MKSFWALVQLTCKSALRSHFFQAMAILFIVLSFCLPLFIHTDGTAAGYIQITLEYSFTMISWVLSVSAVWMGASEITADVENARLHILAVKPVSRSEIYLAKFTGILLCHAALLLFAAMLIYGLTLYRAEYGDWTDAEKQLLKTEVFTGRKVYRPDSVEPQVQEQAVQEMLKRLDEAQRSGQSLPPEWLRFKDKTGNFNRENIIREMKSRIRLERNHIAPLAIHTWTFSNLPEDLDGDFRIRCKMYISETQSDQMPAEGIWGWRFLQANPRKGTERPDITTLAGMDDADVVYYDALFMPKSFNCEFLTYRTQEFQVYPKNRADSQANEIAATYYVTPAPFRVFIANGEQQIRNTYPGENIFMVKDGRGTLLFQNLEAKKDIYTQPNDGPFLLLPQISFFRNFLRTILALLFNVMIFAMMGVGFSAIFSISTGIFITVAYVLFCQVASFLASFYDFSAARPHGGMELYSYYFAQAAKIFFVNHTDFTAAKLLATGEMVEWAYLGSILLFDVILRTAPFFLLGMWCYHRRELGTSAKGR